MAEFCGDCRPVEDQLNTYPSPRLVGPQRFPNFPAAASLRALSSLSITLGRNPRGRT